MQAYRLRDLYKPGMAGLHMCLHQLDGLLHDANPAIAQRLSDLKLTSMMYASQWFLTFFAYRMPLNFVFRVMDAFFLDGIEVLFKCAIALINKSQDVLLHSDFETTLEYLKGHLYDAYQGDPVRLIHDAVLVTFKKGRVQKLANEYLSGRHEDPETDSILVLTSEKVALMGKVKQLEDSLSDLIEENTRISSLLQEANKQLVKLQQESRLSQAEQMANVESQMAAELIEVKLKYAEAEVEREKLAKEVETMRRLKYM